MEIFSNLVEIKRNWEPYKVWEAEQQKNENIDKILRKKYPPNKQDIKKAQQYSKTIVNAIDIMDRNAIDKTEDVGLVIKNYSALTMLTSLALGVGLGALLKKTPLAKKLPDWKPYWEILGMIVTSAIASVGVNIWQADMAKKASRLARFDTRNNELKDYKNFVSYTEEQINEAKKISKDEPVVEKKQNYKLNRENFKPIQAHKDSLKTKTYLEDEIEEYNEWKENFIEKEKNKKSYFEELEKNLSNEELKQAEKDRNSILQAIKKVEKMSNEYSINMEMGAFGLSAIFTTIGTVIGGVIAGGIALIQKSYKIPNKLNNCLKVLQAMLLTIIPGIASVVATAPTVRLIKDAARIGRFQAKKELINNPETFISYSDEERSKVSVPNVKIQQKTFWQQLKDDVKQLAKLKKDAKEYFDYMENKFPEEEKTKNVLKDTKISETQKNEAKKHQQQLFYAFEKIDEKQVSFTEDTAAAIDIAREIGTAIINFVLKIIPIYACAKDVKSINNGKMPNSLKEVLKVMSSGKLKPLTIATLFLPFILPKFIYFYTILKGIQLKKQASMVGIMSAMKDLKDPKNFIVKNDD